VEHAEISTADLVNAAESLQRLAKLLRGLDAAALWCKDAASMTNTRDEVRRELEQLAAQREKLHVDVALAHAALQSAREEQAQAQAACEQAAADAARLTAEAAARAAATEAEVLQRAERSASEILDRAQFRAGQLEDQARQTLAAAEQARADIEAKLQALQQQAASIAA
jgi:hypothetical protein